MRIQLGFSIDTYGVLANAIQVINVAIFRISGKKAKSSCHT